jgi:tyrosine-protein kinase Etk/Wzc
VSVREIPAATGDGPRPGRQPAWVPAARSDVLDIAQLWSTVRQHYRFVLGVALATFALVMTVTLASHMKFRSLGRLYLGELEETGASASAAARSNEIAISANNQGVIGSEVEIIHSRSLVARAILDSGLNVTINAAGKSPPRYGAWLLSRRNPRSLDSADGELLARDSLLTEQYAKERSYRVRFTSNTDYEVWVDERRLGGGKLDEPAQVPGAKLTLMAGNDRKPKRGSEYDLTVLCLADVTDTTLNALGVSAPKPLPPAQPVNVVTVEYSGSSPRVAARFLDSLMAAYLNERQAWKAEDATAAEAFVTDQLQKTRDLLDEFQRKLADYRSKNRVVVTDNEAKAMIEQIGKYEEQRVTARLEVAELSELQKNFQGPNPAVGALLLGGTTDTVIERMASSLSDARQKLTDLDSRFNDSAPEVRAQHDQIEAQLGAVRNYVSSRAQRARENLGTLDSIIQQFEGKLDTVPGAEVGLAQLSRQSDVYDRMYTYLLERQQQTAIIRASTLSKNRVLDVPEPVFREDSPKLVLRLASLPLGLVLGAFLVLLRSFLASSFQSESDVRSVVAGVPILASLPRRSKSKRGRSGPSGAFDVFGGDTTSSFVEAFRMLRTNLYRSTLAHGGKVLLITSPNDGDGKTTCALALAGILAADGKRVLVVDADLRKANQVAASDAQFGLREVLRGECTWVDAARAIPVSIGQFYSLSSGGIAKVELLSSPRMLEFVRDARERCDFVILDAPSFPLVSDALVLSIAADAVLSVFRLQNSSRKLALDHLSGLSSVTSARAVVINDVGQSHPVTKAAQQPQTAASAEVLGARSFRWRSAWWLSVFILLAFGAVVLLSHTPLASLASRTASELRQ